MVLSVPNLVLALALVAVLATNVDINEAVPTWRRLVTLIISLTVVIIPILGRIARAATLAWSGREFVVAARSMGMRDRDIIKRHIVPNVLPALIAVGFLAVGVVIIAEASLSLLGVGIPDGASWGGMLARGRNDLETTWVMCCAVALTVARVACDHHDVDQRHVRAIRNAVRSARSRARCQPRDTSGCQRWHRRRVGVGQDRDESCRDGPVVGFERAPRRQGRVQRSRAHRDEQRRGA
ncbi:MAG: ABC transporter permease subunit [Actinobacteria bacterium]|nr:ABC transporter permease subunit [Actinomycetota bacterium]